MQAEVEAGLYSFKVQRQGKEGSVVLKFELIYGWQKSREAISMGRKRK